MPQFSFVTLWGSVGIVYIIDGLAMLIWAERPRAPGDMVATGVFSLLLALACHWLLPLVKVGLVWITQHWRNERKR